MQSLAGNVAWVVFMLCVALFAAWQFDLLPKWERRTKSCSGKLSIRLDESTWVIRFDADDGGWCKKELTRFDRDQLSEDARNRFDAWLSNNPSLTVTRELINNKPADDWFIPSHEELVQLVTAPAASA